MADCIRRAGAFALSSDFEGMPNALIEAMALGLPCVATDCPSGGCAALIRDGENGLLTPQGTRRRCAAALCRLADEPALAASLGRRRAALRTSSTTGAWPGNGGNILQTAAGRERWNRALDAASDAALAICLFTTFSFQHTLVSTTGMGLMLLVALVRFAVRPRFYGSVWYLGYALVIAWGAVGVLAGWAIEPATALAMCKTMCVGLGFMLVVHQLVVQRRNAEMSLLMCLLACLATMAYALIGERENLFETRVGSAVNIYPNDLAMILSIGYGVAIHRACERRRWYELIPALLLAGTVLLTGSRKGMAMLVLIPAAYLLWRDRRHLRRNLLVLAALLIALAAAVLCIPSLYQVIGVRFVELFRTVFGGAETEGSYLERMSLLRQAWAMFLERPLTGWGLDCYRFNGVTRVTYSHNNPLELLVSGGLPALLLYYGPLLYALVQAVRRAGRHNAVRFVVALTACFLIADVLTISYYLRQQLLPIALMLGVSRLIAAGGDEQDGTRLPRRLGLLRRGPGGGA